MSFFSTRRVIRSLLWIGVAVVFAACSFSHSSKSSSASSESSSKIVSSPFTSSSASSSPDKDRQYQEDVTDYTYAYVRSSTSDYAGFQSGLGEIAAKHGYTNWEAQPSTYVAIGRGLKKAGLKGVEYDTFRKNIAAGEMNKMQDIQKGYESVK